MVPLRRGICPQKEARSEAGRAGKRSRKEGNATAGKAKVTAAGASRQHQNRLPPDGLTDRKRDAKSLADNPQT